MKTLRIGLTGPIGCGKSTVGRWLADEGGVLLDADTIAREVTAPGTPGHEEVLQHFGAEVQKADGTLDRAALARIVFADPDRLRELESIVHPAVRPALLARLDEAEAAGAPLVAIEAIKLVEGGLAALCDEVWLVICDGAVQRQRLAGRARHAADAADMERRIAAQEGLVERLRPAATRLIDTSGTRKAARAIVAAALRDARATASR